MPMSKLSALKKQIAALQAQAERITKAEMSSAIAKVKDIMAEFNLTIEHLTSTVSSKRAAKQTKAKAASVARYADPTTGKTWSGFGRAPGWIAGAKNRDAFLVDKSGIKVAEPAAKAPAASKKAAVKVAKAAKVAKRAVKPAGKRLKEDATAAAAKAAGKTAATKDVTVKKVATKKVAKPKAAAKKSVGRKAPATPAATEPAESTVAA
jgi:DNA-binding protein H-NS